MRDRTMKTMISPDTALDIVLGAAEPMAPQALPLAETLGRLLAQDLRADRDYPPFNRVMMDGFAVRLTDMNHTVDIAGEVAAGAASDIAVTPGTAVSVMTGARCPAGTEAVVPVEQAELHAGNRVRLPAGLAPNQNIAMAGRECRAGTLVAPEGSVVTPLVIANAATYGAARLKVVPPPVCAVIVTGAEVDASADPGAAIRDANGPMLEALLRAAGIPSRAHYHALDSTAAIGHALEAAGDSDVVILSGGVSAGKYDLVPAALREAGVTLLFHKVTQRPGKPLLFGRLGAQLFFGLPGNPLACHLGFHRYIRPALRKRMGLDPNPARGVGCLEAAVQAAGNRTAFLLCRAQAEGALIALHPIASKGSADLHAPCLANAYLRIEPGVVHEAGSEMPFEWIGSNR